MWSSIRVTWLLFLINILTWELTEGLICSLMHTELARLQTAREIATVGQEENSARVVICIYFTMGKGKHVQRKSDPKRSCPDCVGSSWTCIQSRFGTGTESQPETELSGKYLSFPGL